MYAVLGWTVGEFYFEQVLASIVFYFRYMISVLATYLMPEVTMLPS